MKALSAAVKPMPSAVSRRASQLWVVQESLHHDSILGCPLHHAQRVLVAGAVDAEAPTNIRSSSMCITVDLEIQQVQLWTGRPPSIPS